MKYLVGSSYFFYQYEDYQIIDLDYVELIKINQDDEDCYDIKNIIVTPEGYIADYRIIYYKTKEDIIQRELKYKVGNFIGQFLVPELCKEINFTIQDLLRMKPLVEALDKKHLYEKIIYDFYIQNNSFVLTGSQRFKAYQEYKKYR